MARNSVMNVLSTLPELVPPLLTDPQWAEPDARPTPADYKEMCDDIFKRYAPGRMAALEVLGQINNFKRLMYMNFKSHTIFDPDAVLKWCELIKKANADMLCVSEALVPIELALRSGLLCSLEELNEQPAAIQQPFGACPAFEAKKLSDYGGEHKVKDIGWFAMFLELGFEWVVFLNPTDCPYGTNWGNVILMKHKPDEVRCGQLEAVQYKKPWDANESRCYIGVRHGRDLTVSTHLDDLSNGNVRRDQASELGRDCVAWLDEVEGSTITLVGDLNAINPDTYDENERALLDRHNRGTRCPTDAIDELNGALNEKPLNKNKFECRFNKTVTHGYSTSYTRYLDLLTDATDFDHQPLLLYARK